MVSVPVPSPLSVSVANEGNPVPDKVSVSPSASLALSGTVGELSVEQGTETYRAIASEVTGAERDRIYAAMAAKFKNFAEYETMTDRTIPVLALTRM